MRAYNPLAVRWTRPAALLGCLVIAGDLRVAENLDANPLTTISAIRTFSTVPAGRRAVDLRALVTFFDAKEGVVYLQDQSGAIALGIGNPGAAITSGTMLRVTGQMVTGAAPPVVEGAQITALELAAPLPAARPVSIAELLENRVPAEWVQIRGTVGRSLSVEIPCCSTCRRKDAASSSRRRSRRSILACPARTSG